MFGARACLILIERHPKDNTSTAKLFCPVRGRGASGDGDVPCKACATVVAQDWQQHGYKLFGDSLSTLASFAASFPASLLAVSLCAAVEQVRFAGVQRRIAKQTNPTSRAIGLPGRIGQARHIHIVASNALFRCRMRASLHGFEFMGCIKVQQCSLCSWTTARRRPWCLRHIPCIFWVGGGGGWGGCAGGGGGGGRGVHSYGHHIQNTGTIQICLLRKRFSAYFFVSNNLLSRLKRRRRVNA